MALIEWNDQLSVGFAEIDADHQKLVDIVNTLHEAVADGQGAEAIEDILEELLSYTSWHFRHEERLMQLHEYPDFPLHKQEHESLVRQANAHFEQYQQGDASVPATLMPFLKDWLSRHILETDKALGGFLASKA